ncbi:hypothetical protein OTAKU_00540 [Serratia phage vB_SmaM-Otaku]|uniref:Uncharacterized protein n=1 Tax=Serratia phage vB_SmaM-Otaku TaxID=2932867 RepID=A0AAE9HGY6_9CAUD|nr:hypothetical protein PF631_gp54 [Serratia phage vB_SmaM-Otaku]UPU16043.1 hypothetical protein OTAKU_00540 [Serratia phage vB_SmaM-Otaku]
MPKKYKKIPVSVYNATVWVVSNTDEAIKLAWRVLRLPVDPDDFGGANGMCFFSPAGDVLWLPPGASAGTIAHECTHAALNIFRRRGIAVDLDNQEPTTYLIGYLVNAVTEAHRELNK